MFLTGSWIAPDPFRAGADFQRPKSGQFNTFPAHQGLSDQFEHALTNAPNVGGSQAGLRSSPL